MKNIFIILALIVVLILIAFFISNKEPVKVSDDSKDKIQALSTFTIVNDMVKEVGGDKVEAFSLIKPGVQIHGYEPTPSDLVRASKADVIFTNGMNLELSMAKLKANIPDVPVVTVSEGISKIDIAEGSYRGKPNPHAWMSPRQGLIYVENIRKALVDLDPKNEAYYNANAKSYSDKLRVLDKTLSESLATLPVDNRYLVTCEGAFTYLTNDYGLQELYLWAINDESAGSPQQVAKVIDTVREKKIPAVFCESTVEPRIQQEVVQATGAKMGGVLYVDSLTEADGPAPTYLSLLSVTVNNVIKGLTE
jgi:manganese transport system substrate-binding protein